MSNSLKEQESFDELFAIDRRLKTGNYDHQISAINDLFKFIEKITGHEVLMGTTFLRITEYFCATTNEMRFRLLSTLKNIPYKIEKVETHATEIIRRLGMIWESNDIFAKCAILSYMSLLVVDLASKAEAVYRVQQSLLLSRFEEIVDSAIEAAIAFAHTDPALVLPILTDALLKVLQESPPHSHRISKILNIFKLPSFNLKYELLILEELERIPWLQDHPTAKNVSFLIIERTGLV